MAENSKPSPMTEDQLRALTDSEMRQSVGYYGGLLADQRRKAEYYYLGLAKEDLAPPEIEGRSAVVAPVVRNTIEAMLPQLMVKFTGGDSVVEFEPTQEGDDQAAQNATDYLNYLFFKKNSGHQIAYTWFKDALLQKRGIIKVWWDTRSEETREEYRGLTPVELAQIADDPEVKITEQTAYPDEEDQKQRQQFIQHLTQQLQQAQAAQGNAQAMQAAIQIKAQLDNVNQQPPAMLYDVTCVRTKTDGKLTIENVPPEEFLISRKAKMSLQDAPFVAHRVARSMSELRSMGYKNVDQIQSDDPAASLNMERVERISWDDEQAYLNLNQLSTDESQRMVWVTECYIRCDWDGDGIAELRKVTRAGNQILDNEVVDVIPFVSICPVPLPHKFFGLSIADLATESQKTQTAILRNVLDNLYLEVNGRYFAVEGQVNLDDLLMSRPGGVVRMKQPGMAGRLDQGKGNMGDSMNMMEYFADRFTPEATGWSSNSSGTDPQALNKTATATQIVTNKADMRLDLIARNFAEGFVELFKMMLKLVCQHQNKAASIKLSGKWVDMDPREWRNQFDISINVGLGIGNKDQNVAHLMTLFQAQGNAAQLGIVTPTNVYNTLCELAKNMGFKAPDKFVTQPDPNQPPPNPAMQEMQAKLQGQMQIEQGKAQIKAQSDQQQALIEAQVRQREAQLDAQLQAHQQQVQAQQNALQNHLEAQRAQMQALLDARLQAQQQASDERVAQVENTMKLLLAHLQRATTLEVAEMNNATTLQAAQVSAANSADRGQE